MPPPRQQAPGHGTQTLQWGPSQEAVSCLATEVCAMTSSALATTFAPTGQPPLAAQQTAASQPRCSVHPDELSRGTCTRCGAFACDDCLGQVDLCVSCRARAVEQLPPLGRRAVLAQLGLGLTLVLQPTVERLGEGYDPVTATALWSLAVTLLGLGYSVVLISTAVVFCMWFHLAVRHVMMRLGIHLGTTPAAAVGSWFIPFLNLVRPFNVTRRMLQSVGRSDALVTVWQVTWFIGNALSGIADGAKNQAVSWAGSMLMVIAGISCIAIIRRLTNALNAHRVVAVR